MPRPNKRNPTRGNKGTPFPLVDALDYAEERAGGYTLPEDDGTWIESARLTMGIPTATERWSRPEPRTMMVIVPTWFVHPLATPIPTPRR